VIEYLPLFKEEEVMNITEGTLPSLIGGRGERLPHCGATASGGGTIMPDIENPTASPRMAELGLVMVVWRSS
jgi:hypothetical protein